MTGVNVDLTSHVAARAAPESPEETFGVWPCRRLLTAAPTSASHGAEQAQPTRCGHWGSPDQMTDPTRLPVVRSVKRDSQCSATTVIHADGWHRDSEPAVVEKLDCALRARSCLLRRSDPVTAQALAAALRWLFYRHMPAGLKPQSEREARRRPGFCFVRSTLHYLPLGRGSPMTVPSRRASAAPYCLPVCMSISTACTEPTSLRLTE